MKKIEKKQKNLFFKKINKIKFNSKLSKEQILIMVFMLIVILNGLVLAYSKRNSYSFYRLTHFYQKNVDFPWDIFLRKNSKPLPVKEDNCVEDLQTNKHVVPNNMLWGAKPVIYLYPVEVINVSVKVEPTGGVMVSEPDYNEGWYVQAQPNGEIHNYDNGKDYPYLFWEGLLNDYRIGNNGALIEKEKVEIFLETALKNQGLIKNEYDEFIDFWLPRMQEDEYYQVYFLTKTEIDYLAPLKVSPDPETVIRVFMIYRGWDKKMETIPQSWTTPTRKGFTVVEWGGALN